MKKSLRPVARAIVKELSALSGKQLEKGAADVVSFLSQQRLLPRTRELLREIETAWAEEFGASKVTVTSAHRLPAELKEKLEALSAGAEFHAVIDPRLVGGAVVRIDERIIDGSAAGALKSLHSRLQKAI